MHMQDIEVLEPRHVNHLARKGQRIGGIFEEGVGVDSYLMEGNVFRHVRQPERHGVGDEMNLMSSERKSLAQFRGNDPASPVHGVTCNADIHRRVSVLSGSRSSEQVRYA